ncbi:MAG TPA: hypothetical protein VH877_33850 [Polyangia bacterium]|jgi:hypothetical protein|nr:hypothetical protein [Polyangia bacterium]
MPPVLQVVRVSPEAFTDLEPLIDRLDEPAAALVQLVRLGGGEASERFEQEDAGDEEEWAARVEVAGTTVLVRAQGGRWAIYAPADVDEAEAMLAARRLHGLLGQQSADWDLDR